jgi:hypothetical protein
MATTDRHATIEEMLEAVFSVNCQFSANWIAPIVFVITTLHEPKRKHCFQQSFFYCRRVFKDPLPRNGLHHSSIVACVYIASVTQQLLLFTESSLSNGSVCHNIYTHIYIDRHKDDIPATTFPYSDSLKRKFFKTSRSILHRHNMYFVVMRVFYGSTALCWTLAAFSVFWSFYTVNRTPWTGDQSVARPLPTHRTTQTQNKGTQTSMPWEGFEPTIPAFERAKTVHALDRAAIVIGHCAYMGKNLRVSIKMSRNWNKV